MDTVPQFRRSEEFRCPKCFCFCKVFIVNSYLDHPLAFEGSRDEKLLDFTCCAHKRPRATALGHLSICLTKEMFANEILCFCMAVLQHLILSCF